MSNSIKHKLRNLAKSFENWPQNGTNFLELRALELLGALWAPSWRQDGSRMAPRAKINEKCSIWGLPVGSKMEPKWIKNLVKNRIDFCNDFEFLFFPSWVDLGSKNLSQMRGLGVTFSTSLRVCEKCDFEQSLMVLLHFSTLGGSIFDFKRYIFQMFFKDAFKTYFFRFGVEIWPKLGAKWEPKSIRKSIKI